MLYAELCCAVLSLRQGLINPLLYSSRQEWCPESEAGLFKTIVEHIAAELFDAAAQDRSTTDMTIPAGGSCGDSCGG